MSEYGEAVVISENAECLMIGPSKADGFWAMHEDCTLVGIVH